MFFLFVDGNSFSQKKIKVFRLNSYYDDTRKWLEIAPLLTERADITKFMIQIKILLRVKTQEVRDSDSQLLQNQIILYA